MDLKIRYWFDSASYAPDKINSALLRLSKNALLQGGIELPDTAREVVFPKGVPLVRAHGQEVERGTAARVPPASSQDDAGDMTAGEGGLSHERPVAPVGCDVPEATENLLNR